MIRARYSSIIAAEWQNCAYEIVKKPSNKTDIRRSGLVSSSQVGVHPQLEKIVGRHLSTRWSQPLHRPTMDVFEVLKECGALETGNPLLLDSGCGTGKSTRELAARYPDHQLIGVDRSLSRLGKSGAKTGYLRHDNWILVRAELATFWRLAYEAGLKPRRHLLLYPNPWPKPGHLQRRWHGHPVFPWLLALGGEIELRCNWEIYALEFAEAMQIATCKTVEVERYRPTESISPFEFKYLERGHALYSVIVPESVTAASSLPC